MTSTIDRAPRVFHSNSVTSRRFPALRTLTVDDVEVMVMPAAAAQTKKSGAPMVDGNATKTDSSQATKKPVSSSARPPVERPPFRPCNPTEAKETITELRHGYVGIHSPYDLSHKLQEIERAEANAHIISPDVYMPNAWSQARKAITINYFLNSPDAETIEAERRYIQEKAQRNMVEYYRRLRPNAAS